MKIGVEWIEYKAFMWNNFSTLCEGKAPVCAMTSSHPSIQGVDGEHILWCQWNQLFWKYYRFLLSISAPWARKDSNTLRTNNFWLKAEPGNRSFRDLNPLAVYTPLLSHGNTESFALCLYLLLNLLVALMEEYTAHPKDRQKAFFFFFFLVLMFTCLLI